MVQSLNLLLLSWPNWYSMSEMLDDILTKVSQSFVDFYFIVRLVLEKKKKRRLHKVGEGWVCGCVCFSLLVFIPLGLADLTVASF